MYISSDVSDPLYIIIITRIRMNILRHGSNLIISGTTTTAATLAHAGYLTKDEESVLYTVLSLIQQGLRQDSEAEGF